MESRKVVWPDWETVRQIGRGSFGVVYEIQRQVFDNVEKSALKVISIPQNPGDIDEMHSDGYDDESITSTFQSHLKNIVAEYSLMRKMNGSANIVHVDDVRYVQHDDGIGWDIFIKMELLTPLNKALPDNVPEETVVQIAKDMCAALELCKRHEIVHRDIKPQNIFVSSNGDYKLGDFGIAKTVEKTMGGTKIGTYKYMAPEVYNNQPYGSAADIYSLGLVLYWLLNERRMPFMTLPPAKPKAGQDEESRHRRLSGEKLPEPVHGSSALKQIVLKACAYDPKDRYSSAAAMLEDLDKLEGGLAPVVAAVVAGNDTESYEDDKTTGPIFGDTPNTSAAVPTDSDATVGPVFAPKTTTRKEPVIEEHRSETPHYAEPAKKPSILKYILIAVAIIALLLALFVFILSTYKCQIFGHKWLEATCTVARTCDHCGTVDGVPTGHIWAVATCNEPKTCSACEVTEGATLSHQWINATCTEAKTCKLCDTKEGVALGHNWCNANCTTPKTCSSCGTTEGNASGHSWIEATYTAPKTCSDCGLTEGTVKARVVDIAAGNGHTLVLKSDGTVQALGDNEYGECNVSGWSNIVDICAGSNHSVGIKSNGTVIAVGLNNYGQCNVADWKDIVYIAAGEFHTVGVRSDGTVVAAGSNHNGGCDVSGWRNVVAVGVTQTGTVGLTADGKILNTKYEYLNWSGIKAISVGDSLAIGLKNNGSVVIGEPWDRNSNLHSDTYSKFKNIISVEAGMNCVFGLTSDGRVITSPGTDYNGVAGWTDICMIAASDFHIVGLKEDGTLVATGSNNRGECDVKKIN